MATDAQGGGAKYRGVVALANGRWQARITSGGRLHRLGTFDSPLDAAHAYDRAASQLHGASATFNFPSGDDGGAGAPHAVDSARGGTLDAEQTDALDPSVRALAGCLPDTWLTKLQHLQRSAAVALVPMLSPENPLAYDYALGAGAGSGPPKAGSLLSFVMEEKAKHRDKVLLVRVGDFFEAFGADALMLVEFAGLNPMGGKPRAGCPWRNIQATLDGLVEGGLTVAVYEELNDLEGQRGAKRKGLKTRVLSQIVSPGSATYLYDLSLRGDSLDYRDARPFAAVSSTTSGWTLCTVHMDSREFRIFERLTPEALRAKLTAESPVEPVFFASGATSDLPFPPSSLPTVRLPGTLPDQATSPEEVASALLFHLSQLHAADTQDFRHAKASAEAVDFARRQATRTGTDEASRPPPVRPLYVATAEQIGLMNSPHVPRLTEVLLPPGAPAVAHRVLKRWLLSPPPPGVADARQAVLRSLAGELRHSSLPTCRAAIPLGKLVSMLSVGQGNPPLFRELGEVLLCILQLLGMPEPPRHLQVWSSGGALASASNLNQAGKDEKEEEEAEAQWRVRVADLQREEAVSPFEPLVGPLLKLTAHESGLPLRRHFFASKCAELIVEIGSLVAPEPGEAWEEWWSDEKRITGDAGHSAEVLGAVPMEFFRRNEEAWRGSVKPHRLPAVLEAVEMVDRKAGALATAVEQDLRSTGVDVIHDLVNNALHLKARPSLPRESATGDESPEYIHPRDRNGKALLQRYTTQRVEQALGEYVSACEEAEVAVKQELEELCRRLVKDMPSLVHAAHWVALLQALTAHSTAAHGRGWCLPELEDVTEVGKGIVFEADGLVPYWMTKESGAIPNAVDLSNLLVFLTAPNMSGKSTLMRSLLVAALLANCGLHAPCDSLRVGRIDGYFLRTAGHDIPAEGKSAWALEADEMRALLRDASSSSLVMVDELGRGTSSRDGAAVAGALLEVLDQKGCVGVFSTHLHELLDLPLELSPRVVRRRMGFEWDESVSALGGVKAPRWTYMVEEGVCRDSLALVTARQYGLAEDMLARAGALAQTFDMICRPGIPGMAPIGATKVEPNAASPPATTTAEHRSLGAVEEVCRTLLPHDPIFVRVPSGFAAPPSLAATSCVYVLHLSSNHAASFYVGETDNIAQRLGQHRRKGDPWLGAETLVVSVQDKSSARALETSLIRRLAEAGFPLLSTHDGSHRSFSRP